jgi:hypothetical protein
MLFLFPVKAFWDSKASAAYTKQMFAFIGHEAGGAPNINRNRLYESYLRKEVTQP